MQDQANAHSSVDFFPTRSLTVVASGGFSIFDDCTRGFLALVADTSLSGQRVARELDGVIGLRGRLDTIVSGNGAEFASMAILHWCQ
ncbi:hypothetical protein BMIN10S_03657 [Bosea minatitlanensis]